MRNVAVMQPYLFPYIGYFQLIKAADLFVLYDDVAFINKGWINRNQILLNGSSHMFTLSLKGASQNKMINEIGIFEDGKNRGKIVKTVRQAYAKAPCFKDVFPVLERIVMNPEENLAKYIEYSVRETCDFLGIKTKILVSSQLEKPKDAKGQDKIIAICKALSATQYVNPPGGRELYDPVDFERAVLSLRFVKSLKDKLSYPQFGLDYIPWLSIIDVMMFNDRMRMAELLDACVLEEK